MPIGVGHTAQARTPDTHRQPDIDQWPTVSLVCQRPQCVRPRVISVSLFAAVCLLCVCVHSDMCGRVRAKVCYVVKNMWTQHYTHMGSNLLLW